jgi:3-dehydroquinate dehydratase-1
MNAERPMAARPVTLGRHVLGGKRSLICVPIVARNDAELADQAQSVAALEPDVVEWRADAFEGLHPAQVPAYLKVVRSTRAAVLVTCRAATEGGQGDWAENHRLAVLRQALDAGADVIDVEYATSGREDLQALARELGRPVVLSAHFFSHTPSTAELLRRLEDQQAAAANVAKIAVMPRDVLDVSRLLEACLQARHTFLQVPLVGMAMGQLGAYSRVVGPLFGIDLTFGAVGRASAPGQLGLDDLRSARRFLTIP